MINVLTFNEWKDSDDYKINKWFIDKKIIIEKWFEEPSLSELEFDYFEFDTSNNLYELYVAELYFHEKIIQYTLQFLIDPTVLTESIINEAEDEPVQETPAQETPTQDVPAQETAPIQGDVPVQGDNKFTITKIKLVLKGFNIENSELIGTTEREVADNELNTDLLIQLINEFKTEYIKEY